MPSSISNSKALQWNKSWVSAILLALIVLLALEVFWRINGHIPSIVDDQQLWAVERSKVGQSQQEMILLGSSRMQTDISIPTLQKQLPHYNIINLSADSTCPNATLLDLATDRHFTGLVVMETGPECIMFGDAPEVSQQGYVDFFHKTYNFNIKLNRNIATFIQQHIIIVDPYLNLTKVAMEIILKKKWRSPYYLTTHEDRSRAADYRKLDIIHHKLMRLQKVDVRYQQLKPNISFENLTKGLATQDAAVKKIKRRGGNVVFVRFPVSDEHWNKDELFFPRALYWDPIVSRTDAATIHFKDIEGMRSLQCPDTSHLDVRDTETFTKALFEELIKDKIISRDHI